MILDVNMLEVNAILDALHLKAAHLQQTMESVRKQAMEQQPKPKDTETKP